MTAVVKPAESGLSYSDLTLEEALDARSNAIAYLKANEPKIVEAYKAIRDLDTMITLRLEEKGARKFERGGYRGSFKTVKRGSAFVYEPAALRAQLLRLSAEEHALPLEEVDAALPEITPPPVIKPDLRKVRKLAAWGTDVAKFVTAHISEPDEYEVLVIDEIPPSELNVTPAAKALD